MGKPKELRTEQSGADDPLVLHIAENVDQLVNLDISAYGVIRHLYEAARRLYSRPLTLEAARRLQAGLGAGDYFVVTSGWILPGYYPYGENDGPIGTAALGRAVTYGLGARMIAVTEAEMVPVVTAACRAAGLNVLTEDDLANAPRPPFRMNEYCLVIPLPIDDKANEEEARRIFDRYGPKALIAIEKNGPNADGKYCMVDGVDNSDCVAKAGRLFEQARARNVLTIGIGDRGNEIGLGTIGEVPRRILPHGEQATDSTIVDVVVTATVSNWGASGIAAVLAALLDKPEIFYGPDVEARIVERCMDHGCLDGFTGRPILQADGMSLAAHIGVNALLNELVRAPAARGRLTYSTPLLRRTPIQKEDVK